MSSDGQWYVVYTHPHAEARAAEHLERQGFGVYLPRYRKQRRHARKTEIVAPPLFPRYLFVRIDLGRDRWRAIRSTVGVIGLVCQGEKPAPIASRIVEDLKESADRLIHLAPRYEVGSKVRVLDGAFSACVGLFEGASAHDRVSILFNLLGRNVRLIVDASWVAAA